MRLIHVLIVLALPAALRSQDAPRTRLTLQDAIRMAHQQGPSAQIARSIRDAAHWRDDAFNARLLPQLQLSGNIADLNHGITPVLLPDGSTQFVAQSQNQSSLTLGFSQQIPLTGGTVFVGSQLTRLDDFGSASSQLYQSSPVVVSLKQDLF